MAMGKNKRSPLAQLAGLSVNPVPDKTDYPMRAEIRQASNGGFIVMVSGGKIQPYPGEEKVYDDMGGVMHCLEDHFGKGKKESSEKDEY